MMAFNTSTTGNDVLFATSRYQTDLRVLYGRLLISSTTHAVQSSSVFYDSIPPTIERVVKALYIVDTDHLNVDLFDGTTTYIARLDFQANTISYQVTLPQISI